MASSVLTAVAVTMALRLWQSDPGVPYVYFFDGLFHGAVVKSVVDHGWFLSNSSLGAPSGLSLHDFPMGGENLQYLMLKGLGLFSDNWAAVMNAYFLAGFALVATCAHVVFRQIGASRRTAIAMAVLFSVLPYHFVLGESQLFQSTYFAVPLGSFLVLDALGWNVWRAPFLSRAAVGQPRATLIRWAVRAGLVAVVASAGSYYAPFTMVLLIIGGVLGAMAGDRRAVVRALVVVAGLGLVLAANNVPTLRYQHEHGTNPEVAQRAPGESDLYALRVVDLFLPAKGHRLEPLARTRDRLERFWPVSPVWPTPQGPLGVAGATGLAVSLFAAAAAASGSRGRGPERTQLAQLGVLNAAALLVAVSSGFASLLALAGMTQLRVWSRMSVFIAFFALATLGLAMQWSAPRVLARVPADRLGARRARTLGAVLGTVALCVAVLDQTQPANIPDYAGIREVFSADRAFVHEIERHLPPGSAVFQLPVMSFPEAAATVDKLDYAPLRGYLHSRNLRWSYAAMRGRPADWAWTLEGRPAEAMLEGITAAGFTGLYVDRAGFLDSARGLEADLERLVGPPAAANSHGLVFWDLRDRAADQQRRLGRGGVARLRRLVLAPVAARWDTRVGAPLVTPPGDLRRAGPTGQPMTPDRPALSPVVLELTNPLPERRTLRVRLNVRAQGGVPDTIRVTGSGLTAVVPVGAESTPVEFELVVPPGRTPLRIASGAPIFFPGQVVVSDVEPRA